MPSASEGPNPAKPIVLSRHAREQMVERGAAEADVVEAIRTGEPVPAKQGRQSFRKNFQYNRQWGGRTFAVQQILVIVAEGVDVLIVVTVYTFYF